MTLALFSIGGVVFYFSLKNIIEENITENLENTQHQILEYVNKNGTLPPVPSLGSDFIVFAPAEIQVTEVVKDTFHFNKYEDEELPFRELVFTVKTKEGLYTVYVGKPIIEADDMIETVASSLGIVVGILLIILFLLNWLLAKSMWKPFYTTINSLKLFDLSRKETLSLPTTNIAEFKLLNETLAMMAEKIKTDYQSLKEFTENASHEIQTPLAIIRTKLEQMIQVENIPAEQMNIIQDVYESVNRLSKLNQSLLLLTKIENLQFKEIQEVKIDELINKKLTQFEDMISFKKINIDLNTNSLVTKMNLLLADIFLSNLLSNAIRHNEEGGIIKIYVLNESIIISNSGKPLDIAPEKIFDRFQKSGNSSESIGLGLSIVKQICDTYNFKLKYSYKERIHTMTILF